MPSLSMVRCVRCSSMLYTTSTRPLPATTSLMFSLPCLTPTETAYVQLQLSTVQAYNSSPGHQLPDSPGSLAVLNSQVEGLRMTQKTARIVNTPLLAERCLAIGTAYQVDNRSRDLSKQQKQIKRRFPIVFYIDKQIPFVEETGIVEMSEDGLSSELFIKELPSVAQAQSSTAQPKQLLASSQLSPLAGAKHRSFHTSSCLQNKEEELKKKIKLFHFQNPITMLKIFLKFREVKQQWDPALDQEQCLEGAKHAVAAITSMLEEGGRWKEMRGLLSRKEFKRLQKEVETEWSDVMRQNVSLEVEEMEKALITDIRTHEIVHNKFCDIDVLVVGVKEQEKKVPLVMQVEVRLHREYTEGCLPDWVVTRFRIKNFDKRGQTEE
eukprot:GFUD01134454.1.p1 GENE.GFUD01134454.1~~GFUD01134454.1.p1  ORF type:complete len:391 (+),score=151.03 GFUD01134454.1:36-1175(+)